MLELAQIKQFYPPKEQISERNMLREYLQYKLLAAIFAAPYGSRLSFIGGTAIRIIHHSDRFSEDLDFDHTKLAPAEFTDLVRKVVTQLQSEGVSIEHRLSFDGAYRGYLKFPSLLREYGLSAHKQEKVLIQLDTTRQDFPMEPELKIVNRFGVFAQIRVNPAGVLLAQKIGAVLGRKRVMGRDLYDIVYLAALTQPSRVYLKEKLKLSTAASVKQALRKRIAKQDLPELARDILPFVSSQKRLELVQKFDYWLQEWEIV